MKNYITIVIRNLRRNPVFGVIVIGGFSLSLAISLLLASFLFNEYSVDKGFSNLVNIYRLVTEKEITTVKGELAVDLKNNYPGIERICRYDNGSSDLIYNKTPFEINHLVKTDNDFFEIFSVNLIQGNRENPVPDNSSISISSSLAKTIFGIENPIGQIINIQHTKDFTVTSVFEAPDSHSSLQAEAIISWENVKIYGGEWRDGIFYSRLMLLLNKNADPIKLGNEISAKYSKDHYAKLPFKLLPFRESYMSRLTNNQSSQTLHANLNTIRLFSIVTFLILLISVLNIVILYTSGHLSRIKEIAVKKASGAARWQIFTQFIFESVFVSLISFVIAVALAYVLKFPFSSLIQKDFSLFTALQFPNILYVLTGVILSGILAGFYPAVIISVFKPVEIFGNSIKKGNIQIKSGLSVIQYFISIVLIVSLIVMTRQNNFLKNKDIGFSKEQLIQVKVPWEVKDKLPLIKEKLKNNPFIIAGTISHGIPGNVSLWNLWNEPREKYNFQGSLPSFTVDADFFKVFDADFIQGRSFEPGDWNKSVIINETAFKLIGEKFIDDLYLNGIPTPDQAFGNGKDNQFKPLKVIGVIKDINVEKLNQPVAPTVFQCTDYFGVSYLTFRVLPGNYPDVVKNIRDAWNEFCPDFVFNYRFYDEWINSLYTEEQNTASVIRIFALLSIILSCMGTFGIIHFVIRRRIKEIGIRKVNGARVVTIIGILNLSTLKWIGLSFCAGVPVAWFLMQKYLNGFAYKIDLSWWIFVLAGIIVLAIALLTVSWQSWRAATRNPVEALRYE